MSSETQQIHYEIGLSDDDLVSIESEGVTIVSEFLIDKSIERKTMNPVKILFASVAL